MGPPALRAGPGAPLRFRGGWESLRRDGLPRQGGHRRREMHDLRHADIGGDAAVRELEERYLPTAELEEVLPVVLRVDEADDLAFADAVLLPELRRDAGERERRAVLDAGDALGGRRAFRVEGAEGRG